MIKDWHKLTIQEQEQVKYTIQFLKNNNSNFITNYALEFDKNGWTKIEGFLDKNICFLLYDYVKLSAQNLLYYEEHFPNLRNYGDLFGTFEDTQSINNFSKYGDTIFDCILKQKLKDVEWFLNKKLIPTYSYHRLYTTDTILEKHTDRPSCTISGTMFLGNDISNLNDKKYSWPMFVEDKEKGDIPIFLKPGDIIFYKGHQIKHWREKFLGNNHAQVFFHYNEKDKGYDNLYDGRPNLGLSNIFRNKDFFSKQYGND
jgi:hypothetical protein